MNGLIKKADILIEALPYIQKFRHKTVVIKYGGNAMISEELRDSVIKDIILLKYVGLNPVIVHGGGPEINEISEKMGLTPKFHQGLRITDIDTMEVVQMVLVGKVSQDIVSRINVSGGKAIGLSGKDGNLIKVKRKTDPDIGQVGEITEIDTSVINNLISGDFIPVVSPIGIGDDGSSYNINGDTVAGKLAAALKADKLIMMTDVDGIKCDGEVCSTLTIDDAMDHIKSGKINGGMIPKVHACIDGLLGGVIRTHILNGTIPHGILLEIFTNQGIGTMVI